MKRRACLVVSSELTVRAFLLQAIEAMQRDYEITLVLNDPSASLEQELGDAVVVRAVPIARRIAPFRDLFCLATLVRLMRRGRFDIVQSMTPKAGLLAMLAAWISRVPVRVHTFTGQVWATKRGLSRAMLRAADRIVARAATFTLTDSASQREFLVRQRVVDPERVRVLGSGSVCGVNARRFTPSANLRRAVRARLGIPHDAVVLLFLGRLTRDKGVLDLARAFCSLAADHAALRLVMAGPDEERLAEQVRGLCGEHGDRLHICGFTTVPEHFMAAADILCLPSYREGFGSVIIEAAAAGLPAVAARIYGIVDAIVPGHTGLLHEPGDTEGLSKEVDRLVRDPELRRALGDAARKRALADFSPQAITSALLEFYAALLHEHAPLAQNAVKPPADASRGFREGWYARRGKRALDVAVAAASLALLLPFMAIVALVVRCALGSPVLFRQRRAGFRGEPFTLVKFRSMVDAHDGAGHPLSDDERLTRVGRWLRSSSLDELPELWNVLTGDMSLVGPRPLLTEYLPLYSPRQARRHDVRPGITGLAQVNGRNSLSWTKRFELDVEYVENCSFTLDLKILVRTIVAVASRRGISQPGQATVEFFKGDFAGHV